MLGSMLCASPVEPIRAYSPQPQTKPLASAGSAAERAQQSTARQWMRLGPCGWIGVKDWTCEDGRESCVLA